jgi:hypothetical protein
MEYLGSYNKPKAEVHLGHKLTGPKEEEEGGGGGGEEEEEEEPATDWLGDWVSHKTSSTLWRRE